LHNGRQSRNRQKSRQIWKALMIRFRKKKSENRGNQMPDNRRGCLRGES
jgi:hypothetical protein